MINLDYAKIETRMLAWCDRNNPYRGWDDVAAAEWLDGYLGMWLRDYPDDHPITQGRRAAINEWKGARIGCDLGVGCDETGSCYALAHGRPDMCGRP